MTKRHRRGKSNLRILTVDVGGTHVKFEVNGRSERRVFESGPKLSAKRMVNQVKRLAGDWSYDVVSLGYPGLVVRNRVVAEPHNLGRGWVGFDFEKAFGRPVRVVNDAVMQALGSYQGGRMLFLGLGTGLGSAMIIDGAIEPMELAHLPYRKGRTFEEYVGAAGLKRLGKRKWRKHVLGVIKQLSTALEPEYVVLGGGNAKNLGKLPPRVRMGSNDNAFKGGYNLWNESAADGGTTGMSRRPTRMLRRAAQNDRGAKA
jgi:polyphosphate glucokinase